MVNDLGKMFCQFDIGDLVRLVEDYNVDVGYGLVTDVKANFDDIYDLEYLRVRIGTLRDVVPARNDDFFPSKPQVLVLWSGKNLVSSNKSIWMYESELTLVQKAVK